MYKFNTKNGYFYLKNPESLDYVVINFDDDTVSMYFRNGLKAFVKYDELAKKNLLLMEPKEEKPKERGLGNDWVDAARKHPYYQSIFRY